jgi:5-methylcytosine-specific restriction endonuclease McrA
MALISVVCAGCLTPFEYERTRAKQRKWCSDSCRSKTYRLENPEYVARQRMLTAERHRATYVPAPGVALTCSVCGSGFVKRPDAKFCSTKCRYRAMTVAAKASGTKRRTQQAYLDRRRAAGLPVNTWTPARAARDAERRARKQTTQVERIDKITVFERDGWRCRLCGGTVDRRLKHPDAMSATLDHIVPLSRGGTHTWANVQLAHHRCNSEKNAGVFGSGEQLLLL